MYFKNITFSSFKNILDLHDIALDKFNVCGETTRKLNFKIFLDTTLRYN